MIKYNNKIVDLNHFPDGTLLLKETANVRACDSNTGCNNAGSGNVTDNKADSSTASPATITWLFESNEELVALYFLTKHLRAKGVDNIQLKMPYIPNARQDRVKNAEDVFTLKYFAEMINGLGFSKVTVLDPHSYVSEALIDRVEPQSPKMYVERVLEQLKQAMQVSATQPVAAQFTKQSTNILLFFPDEGAMKRYSAMFDLPYVFGIKKRDWVTGKIQGLSVSGQTELIPGSTVLIVDDICSKGGTFYHSAKALKELGAGDVYLYISHCENTILEGEILKGDLIKKVYTTNSIFTKTHENVEVYDYE